MFLYGTVADGEKEVEHTKSIPIITDFIFEKNGEDSLDFEIQANYIQIKQDIVTIFESELTRINKDA